MNPRCDAAANTGVSCRYVYLFSSVLTAPLRSTSSLYFSTTAHLSNAFTMGSVKSIGSRFQIAPKPFKCTLTQRSMKRTPNMLRQSFQHHILRHYVSKLHLIS